MFQALRGSKHAAQSELLSNLEVTGLLLLTVPKNIIF